MEVQQFVNSTRWKPAPRAGIGGRTWEDRKPEMETGYLPTAAS